MEYITTSKIVIPARPAVAALSITPFSVEAQLLQAFDFSSQIFLRFTELLLKPSKELIVFSFCKRKVVIRQLRVFLFEFALHFIPAALQL